MSSQENLGKYLASLRAALKMSLREVEKASNKNVSNAYLSQVETGKISNPSPSILFSLAEIYGVPYDEIMQKAGYLPPKEGRVIKSVDSIGQLPRNISKEEETQLIDYLNFLRSKKK